MQDSVSDIIIIGGGIAGLGASFALRRQGKAATVFEKTSDYGGLCGNFTIAGGFRFDRFVHFSFAKDEEVNDIFRVSTGGDIITHTPNPYNIYNGIWIKHPAQNNLFPLSDEEKREIIEDFRRRPSGVDPSSIADYEKWLRIQYGNAFAERFPMAYTPKYWMSEARELETGWVGNRLYQPSLEEVMEGARSACTPVTYYAKEMRYPAVGGFKRYLSALADGADIRYDSEVTEINPADKTVTSGGDIYHYSRLISSMPLPVLINSLKIDVPKEVSDAAGKLRCTSGYQISVALKGDKIPPYLWWYIYDRDILPARVYSPSLKSPDNAPAGCSSLQLEVYCAENDYSRGELIEKSVKPLIELGAIRSEDIIEVDVRFEPWANVIFDHNIHAARRTVLDFVRSLGIKPIGRFGLWDYLWTDQSLMSGLEAGRF